MRRRLMILATVVAVLMVVASGGWWVWREYYSSDQIQAAVDANDPDRVALLIKLGAPVETDVKLPDEVDPMECKLLHWAALEGHLPVVLLLLNSGAKVESRDQEGGKPLCYAAMNNYFDVAELLLSNGAEVESKDIFGWTPLHWTAAAGSAQVAELLLSEGADTHVLNEGGKTPLDVAIEEGSTIMADLLKAHMANNPLPEWKRDIFKQLEKKAPFDLNGMTIGASLEWFSKRMAIEFSIHPAVDKSIRVIMKQEGMTGSVALTWLTELVGIEWGLRNGGVYIVNKGELTEEERLKPKPVKTSGGMPKWERTINKRLQIAWGLNGKLPSFYEAVDFIRAVTNINIIVHPAIPRNLKIAFELDGETFRDALNMFTRNTNTVWEIRNQAVYVKPSGKPVVPPAPTEAP